MNELIDICEVQITSFEDSSKEVLGVLHEGTVQPILMDEAGEYIRSEGNNLGDHVDSL